MLHHPSLDGSLRTDSGPDARSFPGPGMTEQTSYSVIVPTHARPGPLASCLDGWSRMRFPRDRFEVVVSDDGSPLPVEPVVARFRDRLRLTVVTGPNAGPAAARNRGAAHARGRHLVFADDDCVPDPELLAALERRFATAPEALVGGGIVNALPENPFSTATQQIVGYAYGYAERMRRETRLFTTSILAVPSAAFRRLGGFSEDLPTGEDYDFCHRWQHAGGAAVYAPEVVVRHAHHLTLRGFWRQHFRYGRGLLLCRLRIARRTRQRLRGERGSFYLNLLRFPLTQGDGARGWFHAGLVALSQLATFAGAAWEGASLTLRAGTEERRSPDPGLTR
jgi:GT2 family glycosyltransferase